MLTVEDFPAFYDEVHGGGSRSPFPWQTDLLEMVDHDGWPNTIGAPTGLGKTSVLDVAIFAAALAATRGEQPRRRYFFVVDRRLVVDEAYDHAERIRRALASAKAGTAADRVAAALAALHPGSEHPVLVTRMRGGVTWDSRWVIRPDQVAIVTGTVDQVGSRLLFRGYGVSPKRASIDAALVGTDSLLFVDEAHLAEPMLRTVDAVQALDGEATVRPPALVVSLSATLRPTASASHVARLDFDLDRNLTHPVARQRLTAPKRLVTAETPSSKAVDVLVAAAKAALNSTPGGLVAVVTNTVSAARQVFDATASMHEVHRVLLTGRIRPADRERLVAQEIGDLTVGWRDRELKTRLLVATQTVEVGANLDVDVLVTESAPWPNLVQRTGRVNRVGAAADGLVLVVHPTATTPSPVYGLATQETWDWLVARQQPVLWSSAGAVRAGWAEATTGGLDVSPRSMLQLASDDTTPRGAGVGRVPPVVTRDHLDCWVRTGPVPVPDVPVAPFLHGFATEEQPVRLVWRADITPANMERLVAANGEATAAIRSSLVAVPPRHDEMLEVPASAVRAWLSGGPQSVISDDESAEEAPPSGRSRPDGRQRQAVAVSYTDGDTELRPVAPADVRPGQLLVVPALYGGNDAFGWCPASRRTVVDVADLVTARPSPGGRVNGLLRLDMRVLRPLLESLASGRDADARARVAALADALDRLDTVRREADEDLSPTVRRNAQEGPDAQLLSVLAALEASVQPTTLPADPWAAWWRSLLHEVRAGRVSVPDDNVEGRVLLASQGASWLSDESGPSASSDRGEPQGLDEHHAEVAAVTELFGAALGLSPELVESLALAGARHDLGKVDPRFQAMLSYARGPADTPLAKSGMPADATRARREAQRASGYPTGGRHEALSRTLVAAELAGRTDASASGLDSDLVVHLVSSHHGHSRPLLPPVVDPERPSSVLIGGEPHDTGSGQVAWEAVNSFAVLNARYGRWGLALLETVVRLADIAASAGDTRVDLSTQRERPWRPPAPSPQGAAQVDTHRHAVSVPALVGTSPLGFLAALGVIVLLGHSGRDALLSWEPESGTAVVHSTDLRSVDDIVSALWSIKSQLHEGQYWPGAGVGFPPPREAPDPLVVPRGRFADMLVDLDGSAEVATRLVTDLAVNDKGLVRRTPLVAPTGKQSFFTMVRNQHNALSDSSVLREALVQWRRRSGVPAEGFDRAAILGGADAADGRPGERSVPGATWLAVQALQGMRLAGDTRRPASTAWRPLGSRGSLVWALWSPALTWSQVVTLLEHPRLTATMQDGVFLSDVAALRPLGVWRVCVATRRPTGNSDGPLVAQPVRQRRRDRAAPAMQGRSW